MPAAPERPRRQVTAFVQELRQADLYKLPGVAETLDWTTALVALDQQALDPAVVDETLGVILKYQDDVDKIKGAAARAILDRVQRHGMNAVGRHRPGGRRSSGGHLLHNLLLFGRLLRGLGLDVNPGRMIDLVAGAGLGRAWAAAMDFYFRRPQPAGPPPRGPAAVRPGFRASGGRRPDVARPALT